MLKKHWARHQRALIKTLLIMKLVTIIFLSTCLAAGTKGVSQSVTLKKYNAPLEEIFKQIEKQTGYSFVYTQTEIARAKKVDVNVRRMKLEELLRLCFKDQLLLYTLKDNFIIVRPKVFGLDPGSPFLSIPPPPVDGRILDESGKALEGATVRVKNSNRSTVTDANGHFSLSVARNDILVITYVGYVAQEVKIGSNQSLAITLKADLTALADVTVIGVGYGTLSKKEVTSAITHLSSKDLLQVGGNGALMSMQGKVAGLSVTNTATGDPNSNPTIQLRGVSSRSAGLGPLYVVNGIPGANIENINQNDIESIDVLKGGAASAIYGTRGGNGVILITTKKGTQQTQAFYDGYAGFDFATNQIKVLSREKFLEKNRGTDFGGNTDWFKAVLRDHAFSQKHTLQVSGGNAKTNYIVSTDYRKAQGLDLRSKKEEYGARLNLNHTSANNLYTVSVTLAPRYFKQDLSSPAALSQAITLNPTQPVNHSVIPGRYNNINSGFAGAFNPVEELMTVQDGSEGKFLDWNTSFQLNLLKNLNTQVTLGQQTQDFFKFKFTPSYNTRLINTNGGRNTATRNYDKNDQKSFEWTGNYNTNIGEHSFKLLAGYSYYYFNASGLGAANQGFPSDLLTYNNLRSGTWNLENGVDGTSSYKNDSKLIGFFGRVNYDFGNRYYVSASLRREGSSKFGRSNKWGYFPAASAGWILTNEKFFPSLTWLNALKLRADYGVTGNQDFGNYLSLDTYQGFGFVLYENGNYQVWGPSQNPNFDLRWERAENFNVGLDFEMFTSKITGSINYYIRQNKDLLGNYTVPIPPYVEPIIFANVGSMKNSGVELEINARVIQTKNFSYNLSFIGASNANKFVSFSNDTYQGQPFVNLVSMPGTGATGGAGGAASSAGTAQRLEEGVRIGSFYMLKSAGVDESGGLLVYAKDGKIIPANTSTLEDRQYVGNGLPKFTASLGHSFIYKKFDLGIFLRGTFGYDIYNTAAFYLGTPVLQSNGNVLATAFDGGKYSKLTNAATYSSLSDYFLEKGDFVKIDNVTLGFNAESPVKYLNSIRLYVTGRNLYTFTKYKGGDPESIQVNGLTPGIVNPSSVSIINSLSFYPSSLQLLLGLQLKF